MSGRVSQNLRSGFLHEELGILLVRQVAVVAPVPRPDDVGTDGIATLLRPPIKTLQYADSSFYVQFKARSVGEVAYNINPRTKNAEPDRGELAWLRALQLPFFIGSVDDTDSSIRLYTAIHAYEELVRNTAAVTLRLRFGPEPDPLAEAGAAGVAEGAAPPLEAVAAGGNAQAAGNVPAGSTDLHPIAYLGDPIYTWTMVSHHEENFYTTAYNILKPWMEHEHGNCFCRKLGLLQKATWITGQPPVINDASVVINSSANGPGIAPDILRAMKPVLRSLLVDRLIRGSEAQHAVLDHLIDLSRTLNVDLCPEDLRGHLEEATEVARNDYQAQQQN